METPDFPSYFLIRIKLARTVNEIHGDLLSTFPDSCPGLSTLQRWNIEFDKGVFALEKKTRPGRPRETRREENVARVKRLHSTSGCRGVPTIYNCFQASDGGCRAPKPPQRARPSLPAGTTANRSTMIEYLRRTGKRFLSLKKNKIRLKDCLLMWDNARPHTATDTRKFLTRRDVEPVKHSPYSPDLNLCDRFLFQKTILGGHEEATLAVQRAIRRVSEDELYDQLRKLRVHCHDVIAVGGGYVY
ncbi:Uncharacterized protein FKW44_003093 [Caligus rogercresseyi]|uniref:Histone-lysine N-methyltransferase SETMAR n=1 Tax=Caligus rogercresseyi TaxID=217165 RepID=A0A7T8KL46_CALRO|nr:Uncharacterized protein FKW44_003093 [Caligus rogercresseyi]